MSEQQPITIHPDTKEVYLNISGFNMKTYNEYGLLNILTLLAERDIEFKDALDQRLKIDKEGLIRVIQIDPWTNLGWKNNDVVCHAADLAGIICVYGSKAWLTSK